MWGIAQGVAGGMLITHERQSRDVFALADGVTVKLTPNVATTITHTHLANVREALGCHGGRATRLRR